MEQATTRTILLIIQDGPYGTERAYNGLRLAMQLVKQTGVAVTTTSSA